MLLCLTKLQGMGVIPVLKINCNPFALFPFIEDFYIFHSPLSITTSFSAHPTPLNQSHFWGKSKVKHTGADIACFFQDAKSSLEKHKKCYLEAPYGTSQTSKL